MTSTDLPPSTRTELRVAARQALVWLINVIGIAGIFLIAYGLAARISASNWPILDAVAYFLSSLLTLLGAAATAFAIYLPRNQRPPDPFSRYISAPLVLIGALTAIVVLVFDVFPMPPHVVNGFGLLAISGALFRLVSR